MTQRQIDEQTFAALDQLRELSDAQARYIRNLELGELPHHEKLMIGELLTKTRAARDYAELTMKRFARRLDPYEDLYAIQPFAPVTMTANGLVPSVTGFCNYSDMFSVQEIATDTLTVLHNSAISINDAQKPMDVRTFFQDDKIIVDAGDAVAIRVQATIVPVDGEDIATQATIGLRIANGPMIFPAAFQLSGYAETANLSYSTTAYAGMTWARSGAQVVILTDGPVHVTSRALLVARLHKARVV